MSCQHEYVGHRSLCSCTRTCSTTSPPAYKMYSAAGAEHGEPTPAAFSPAVLQVVVDGICSVWSLLLDIEQACGKGRVLALDIGGGLTVNYSSDDPPQARMLAPRCACCAVVSLHLSCVQNYTTPHMPACLPYHSTRAVDTTSYLGCSMHCHHTTPHHTTPHHTTPHHTSTVQQVHQLLALLA
jgi:hypothetical protein